MSPSILRIGTRGSQLALWQAEWVKSQLERFHADLQVELVTIKTKGDKILDVPLAQVGGKGLFVKELEEAMLDGRVDICVHSMKDVPAEFPEGLGLGAILEREDPRDALLSVHYQSLEALPRGAKVGSSSLRRQSQLRHLRPDLEVISLRGNVNTRIGKLEAGAFDAIVLAAAGVKRLKMTERVVGYFDPMQMLPAIGQGAVGIEQRLDDERTAAFTLPLNHPETETCVMAERAFQATLEGGCQVPMAAHAHLAGSTMEMTGLVASLDGAEVHRLTRRASVSEAELLGYELARAVGEMGGDRILAELRPADHP